MKVLIIHHLEEIWKTGYKNAGTSFWSLEYKFGQFLENNSFDKVILTKFELPSSKYFQSSNFINDYPNIWQHINHCHEYAYGWSAEELEKYPEKFIKGGCHSEAVLITDWMKEIKNDEVYISGAFEGECLEDLEVALNYLDINFKKIKELCI